MSKDTIYTDKLENIEAFQFDKAVTQVFPDMIERSVPGYGEIISLTGSLASMHATQNSNIYDLGCSLGASSLAMRNYITTQNTHLIAVDNSKDMVAGCKKNLTAQKSEVSFEVREGDLLQTPIENASVVVMNFILQFIPLEERDALLKNIFDGLQDNGVLILAEKTTASTTEKQQHLQTWHEGFKKANGYSTLEIAQKRTALENVLISETEQDLIKRLENAGFVYVQKWFQAFNFKAFIAFKR